MILFDQPLVFVALPVLALLVAFLEWRVPGSRRRRVARVLVRTLVLACVVAALAGPHGSRSVERPRRLVVAIDRAARLPKTAAAEAEVVRREAETAARAVGAAFAVVEFTDDAAAGLARARLAFADGETGGIVLVTDGNAGLEGLARTTAALRAQDVAVNAAAVPRTIAAPVAGRRIVALAAPALARGPFSVNAAFEGPQRRSERCVLRVDGDVVQTVAGDAEGATEVRFDELDLEPGLHELAVTLEDPDGRASAHARRLVTVSAPPRAVSVLGAPGPSAWRKALEAQGLQLAEAQPEALAALLNDASALPDLVVADASGLERLSPEAAHLLAERIRDGLGLVLEPGTDKAAWAALATSPLRDVLPLIPRPEPPPPPKPDPEPTPPEPPPPEIDPPEPEKGPGLKAERRPEEALPITLLLVVDRSPSMSGAKMAMAILGAQEAARKLSPWDRIGIITFAHDVTLNVAPRSVRGASSLPLWLSTVEAGGRGTNIAGALRMARQVFEKERSPILHLILLTDGRQHPPGPIFGPIVKPMRRRGITITAVGIGRGARMDQLREIVQWAASGMVIRAATARDIPVVLTRDTREVAERRSEQAQAIEARLRKKEDPRPPRPPEEDDPTPPPRPPVEPKTPEEKPVENVADTQLPLRFLRPHEALAGLEDARWPSVGVPRLADVAPGAVVLVERQDGRPALAAKRPGLGRVLQWSLPADDAGLLGWTPLGRLYGQVARAVVAPRGAFGYLPTLRVSDGPDGALLEVDWPGGTSTGVLEVTWHGPDATQALGRFTPQDAAGARPLPEAAPGSLCRIEATIAGGPTLPPRSYLAREVPREAPRAADPRALAAALGAPLQPVARFAEALPVAQRSIHTPYWPWFVWAAIALLPLDVFLHRRRTTT